MFFTSNDGTRVPMFVTSRIGAPLDGTNPTSCTATAASTFPHARLLARDRGLAGDGRRLAVANLRGGGEYGRTWHEAGMKLHKQNVFDDFIAAADT